MYYFYSSESKIFYEDIKCWNLDIYFYPIRITPYAFRPILLESHYFNTEQEREEFYETLPYFKKHWPCLIRTSATLNSKK